MTTRAHSQRRRQASRRFASVLVLLCLALGAPLTASGESKGIPRWAPLVRDARWIAAGTIARESGEGVVANLPTPLKGTPPKDQLIASRIRGVPTGTPVIVHLDVDGIARARFQMGPSPDWIGEAKAAVRALVRLLESPSLEHRTSILREMIASAQGEPLSAARDYWRENPSAADYHCLVPALLQTIKTSQSDSAALDASMILMKVALPSDLPEVITVLERDDNGYRAKMLAQLDRLTRPSPPPRPPPASASEAAAVIKERRAWYSAHKDELRLLGRLQPRPAPSSTTDGT